jgi:phosphomannomutase/phosphoglucomutase
MTRLFGTNGIRGVVNKDMNSEIALEIGTAWGYVSEKNDSSTEMCGWH